METSSDKADQPWLIFELCCLPASVISCFVC